MNDRRKRKEKKRLTIKEHDRPITCITHSIIHAKTVAYKRSITRNILFMFFGSTAVSHFVLSTYDTTRDLPLKT